MSRRPPNFILKATPRTPTAPTRASNVARGTAYELAVRAYLLSAPYNCSSLIRIGGAGDAGVDLRGRWGGQPVVSSTLPHPPHQAVEAGEREDGEGVAKRAKKWSVVVQCKAYSKPIGPAVVRELEGVLSAEEAVLLSTLRRRPPPPPSPPPSSSPSDLTPLPSPSLPINLPPPTIGFLFSLSGFSPSAATRGLTSKLPLSLCHLRPKDPARLEDAARRGAGRGGVVGPDEVEVVSLTFNRALQRIVKGEENGWDER